MSSVMEFLLLTFFCLGLLVTSGHAAALPVDRLTSPNPSRRLSLNARNTSPNPVRREADVFRMQCNYAGFDHTCGETLDALQCKSLCYCSLIGYMWCDGYGYCNDGNVSLVCQHQLGCECDCDDGLKRDINNVAGNDTVIPTECSKKKALKARRDSEKNEVHTDIAGEAVNTHQNSDEKALQVRDKSGENLVSKSPNPTHALMARAIYGLSVRCGQAAPGHQTKNYDCGQPIDAPTCMLNCWCNYQTRLMECPGYGMCSARSVFQICSVWLNCRCICVRVGRRDVAEIDGRNITTIDGVPGNNVLINNSTSDVVIPQWYNPLDPSCVGVTILDLSKDKSERESSLSPLPKDTSETTLGIFWENGFLDFVTVSDNGAWFALNGTVASPVIRVCVMTVACAFETSDETWIAAYNSTASGCLELKPARTLIRGFCCSNWSECTIPDQKDEFQKKTFTVRDETGVRDEAIKTLDTVTGNYNTTSICYTGSGYAENFTMVSNRPFYTNVSFAVDQICVLEPWALCVFGGSDSVTFVVVDGWQNNGCAVVGPPQTIVAGECCADWHNCHPTSDVAGLMAADIANRSVEVNGMPAAPSPANARDVTASDMTIILYGSNEIVEEVITDNGEAYRIKNNAQFTINQICVSASQQAVCQFASLTGDILSTIPVGQCKPINPSQIIHWGVCCQNIDGCFREALRYPAMAPRDSASEVLIVVNGGIEAQAIHLPIDGGDHDIIDYGGWTVDQVCLTAVNGDHGRCVLTTASGALIAASPLGCTPVGPSASLVSARCCSIFADCVFKKSVTTRDTVVLITYIGAANTQTVMTPLDGGYVDIVAYIPWAVNQICLPAINGNQGSCQFLAADNFNVLTAGALSCTDVGPPQLIVGAACCSTSADCHPQRTVLAREAATVNDVQVDFLGAGDQYSSGMYPGDLTEFEPEIPWSVSSICVETENAICEFCNEAGTDCMKVSSGCAAFGPPQEVFYGGCGDSTHGG